MNACLFGSPRSEIRRHATCCLCLHCSGPLKTAQVLRLLLDHLLSSMEGHRPRGIVTGHGKVVIDQLYSSRLEMNSRLALNVIGRPTLPAESCFAAAEGKQGMAMHFQSNVCTTTLLIMLWTQGRMVLDPRATNHAFPCMMAKESCVRLNMEWNAQNT